MSQELVIGAIPTNKLGIQTYTINFKNQMLEGNIDPLKGKQLVKIMGDVAKSLNDDKELQELWKDTADRWTEKTFSYNGMEITKTSRKTYNFLACNDSKYDELISQLEKLKLEIKDREEFLKAIKEPISNLDGEIINPAPYTTTTGLTLKPL